MTLVLGLASFVAGCIADGAPPDSEPEAETTGEVTWVDDGDTIEVDRAGQVTEVRLVAVNAPDQGECFADRALDHLVQTLRDRTVRLEVVGEDQFGRALAHVFDGDRHVNLELVEMGIVVASTPEEDDPYREAMLQAEDEAHSSGEGLWATAACGSHGPVPDVAIDPDRSTVDPVGPDDQNLGAETITIVNDGAEPIDLTGWIIRDESTRHRFTFDVGSTIGAGETLTVSSTEPGWDPGDSPVWNNGGDMALVQLPDGTVVARWRY